MHLQTVMTYNVIAEDGYRYERAAITRWLQHNRNSPVTGKLLQHKHLLPNVWLKQAMDMHKAGQNGA